MRPDRLQSRQARRVSSAVDIVQVGEMVALSKPAHWVLLNGIFSKKAWVELSFYDNNDNSKYESNLIKVKANYEKGVGIQTVFSRKQTREILQHATRRG